MSVIRRPDVLGSRTQRRVDGVTGALSAAIVEVLSVGTWFYLVVVETRTVFTALAGLGVLLFGALLRTGFFGAAVRSGGMLTPWRRLVAAAVFAGSWLCWLLIAEWIGGRAGLTVAGVVLAATLTLQFWLEGRAIDCYPAPSPSALLRAPGVRTAILPGLLVAGGATVWLATMWLIDWSLLSLYVPVGSRVFLVEVRAFMLAFLVLAWCSFVAHERRIRHVLAV